MTGHRPRVIASRQRVSLKGEAVPHWEREKLRVYLRCSNPECREVFWRIPSQATATHPCCSRRCVKAWAYLAGRERRYARRISSAVLTS
jgi:hypothetical protein